MHIQRLKRLITVLENLRPEQFNIRTFGRETNCGTVACAVGWGALDPELMSQGLSAEPGSIGNYIRFGGLKYNAAIQAFFDLDVWQTRIFYRDHYCRGGTWPDTPVTTQDVIRAIEHLIYEGKPWS